MATRELRKRVGQKEWAHEQTIELLARLDLFIESRGMLQRTDDKIEFLKIMSRHFEIKYTLEEIRANLYDIWRHHRSSTSTYSFEDLFRIGSRALDDLDDNTRTILETRKESLRSQTPRQTRMSSRILGYDSPYFKREETDSPARQLRMLKQRTPRRPTPQSPVAQRQRLQSQGPQRSRRKSRRLQVQPPRKPSRCISTSKSAKLNTLLSQRPIIQINVPRHPTFPRLRSLSISSLSSISESALENLISPETPHTQIKTNPVLSSMSEIVTPEVDYNSVFFSGVVRNKQCMDCSQLELLELVPQDTNLHRLLSDMLSDITYFRTKYSLLEEKVNQYEREQRVAASMKNKCKDETIFKLHAQIASMSNLENHRVILHKQKQSLDLKMIREHHNQLKRHLQSLSSMDHFQRVANREEMGDYSDLRELEFRIGIKAGQQFQPNKLVQSLAGTAACEWVFMEKLESFSTMETPLLKVYRTLINAKEGDNALRDYDFAAHRLVLESKPFQEGFLPTVAQSLASRLLKALNPMIKANYIDRVEGQLRIIFLDALRVKTVGMIGQGMLEIVWPSCGSAFVPNLMEKDIGGEPPIQKPGGIILPLVPGFTIHEYERKLVEYGGFTSKREYEEEEMGKKVMVAPALVLA